MVHCFKEGRGGGCQTPAVKVAFNRIWRKLSTSKSKPRNHSVGKVLNDSSQSHHTVCWPPVMLLAYFHITHKLILCFAAPWTFFQTKRCSFFSFLRVPPSPSAGLSPVVQWESVEQPGHDLQAPPLLHHRGGNASGK